MTTIPDNPVDLRHPKGHFAAGTGPCPVDGQDKLNPLGDL